MRTSGLRATLCDLHMHLGAAHRQIASSWWWSAAVYTELSSNGNLITHVYSLPKLSSMTGTVSQKWERLLMKSGRGFALEACRSASSLSVKACRRLPPACQGHLKHHWICCVVWPKWQNSLHGCLICCRAFSSEPHLKPAGSQSNASRAENATSRVQRLLKPFWKGYRRAQGQQTIFCLSKDVSVYPIFNKICDLICDTQMFCQ